MELDLDYEALRNKAAAFDLSTNAKFKLEGEERTVFLNNLITADISKLQRGQAQHAAFLDRFGKVLADVFIYDFGAFYIIEATQDQRTALFDLLARYAKLSKVGLADVTDSWKLYSVQGPTADSFKDQLSPHPLFSRSRTGEPGFDVFVSGPETEHFLDKHPLPIAKVEVLEIARIEAGIPKYGKDITPQSLVLEGGFKDAISYQKGCYVGQEIVSRMKNLGGTAPFILQGFIVKGNLIPKQGDPILFADKEVGKVTSACHSPLNESPLIIGRVRSGMEGLTVLGMPLEPVDLPGIRNT